MLTGDENLVAVNFEVQWQIENAKKFLFNVYDPQLTVRNAAESAMREMIGTTPLSEILSEGRSVLQQKTKELLQSILDSYDSGVHIETINMRGVPPANKIKVDNIVTGEDGEMKSESIETTVDQSFKDVQAAIINKEEIINMAIARSNEVIPEARGQGQKLIQEAQGYKEQVIAKAQGEANRFNAIYNEYKKAKDVTKKRIYFETMEQIMEGMDKIIMDSKNNGIQPYIPMKELGSKQ
jgi:membrane protease subunit HflK